MRTKLFRRSIEGWTVPGAWRPRTVKIDPAIWESILRIAFREERTRTYTIDRLLRYGLIRYNELSYDNELDDLDDAGP